MARSRTSHGERLPLVLLVLVGCVFAWSGLSPRDRFTWWLEVAPVIIAVPVLWTTWRRFPLTPLAYTLIALHACILLVGGRYTYAEVPLFNTLRDALHLTRNHYDRVGHFAQGFVPAILAREVLLRTSPLRRGGWLFVLVTAVALSISAAYELIEWAAAVSTGEKADAFLGTQGDPWDTQTDMALALIGALVAQLLLRRAHDAHLARFEHGNRSSRTR